MSDFTLVSKDYVANKLVDKQNKLVTDDLSISLTDTEDGTIIRATGQGTGIPVDDNVDPLSSNPVKSFGIAIALGAKQNKLTSENAGDNITITTNESGVLKINSTASPQINVLEQIQPGKSDPVSSNSIYAALYGTQNSYSMGKCGMPYLIVNVSKDNGCVDFEQFLDPTDTDKTGFYMANNGIYVFWDNDWSHESTDSQYAVYSQRLVRWPFWFAPPLFGEAQIHIFNHRDTELKFVWPNLTMYYDAHGKDSSGKDLPKVAEPITGGWKWYDEETNTYNDDVKYTTDETAMVIPPNTTRCITLIHSLDGTALLSPERKVHTILCKVAYDYTMSERSYTPANM